MSFPSSSMTRPPNLLDPQAFENQFRPSPFSQNSSQILHNPSVPFNMYAVNPSQFQIPPSQMASRDAILDDKTRRKQAELLSASYQGQNVPSNGQFEVNNYLRIPNQGEDQLNTNPRSMLNSRSMLVERTANPYGSQLKQEIQRRQLEKKNGKIIERLLDQKMLADRANNDWFGKQGCGAPIRDQFGNIITARKKQAGNPTLNSEWVSPPSNQITTRGENLLTSSMPNLNPSLLAANMNINDPSFLNEERTGLTTDPQPQFPQINVLPPRTPGEGQMGRSTVQMPMNPLEIEAYNRREKEKAAQQENFMLMEVKRKEKENERLMKKKEAELMDLRLQKEKEEQEARKMFDYGNQGLESRNLYETNFDMGKLLGKTTRMNFMPNRTLREQVQVTTKTEKSVKRPRTPLEEVEREMRELRNKEENLRLQQRLMQELPVEVSKTVQSTVDVEMLKLKNELNFQQNLLGEQIMGLKGELLKSNEHRQESEKEVKRLQKEIQKTQLVDEIRQRELYMALILKNRKPAIYHTVTQRLEEPEYGDFRFPERPKPYYNVYDPSIEDIEFRNRDLHEIINNRTELIPMGFQDAEKVVKGSSWDQGSIEGEKYAYGMSVGNEEMPNLPDDYANLQGVTQPRMVEDGDHVYYLDRYTTNVKRLESLEERDPREELERLDGQLFNVLHEMNKGKSTFDDLREINHYSSNGQLIKINERNSDYYD